MYVQEKALFMYADNEAHMQGHYFNWELTSTFHDDFCGMAGIIEDASAENFLL
jgi:hypothetical protein